MVGFLPEYYTDHTYVGNMRSAIKLGLVDKPARLPDNIALIQKLVDSCSRRPWNIRHRTGNFQHSTVGHSHAPVDGLLNSANLSNNWELYQRNRQLL